MAMGFWTNRRTLVTGGAGFIGSHLVERLVELGARVRVVDNLERGRQENLSSCLGSVEFWRRDLRHRETALAACQGMEIVCHLASKVGGIGYYLERPGEVITQNILMDTLVLDSAARVGVERYIYASSGFVYPAELQQRPDASPLKEEDALPGNPAISYGWAKLLAEKALEYVVTEGSHLQGAILRLVGAFGPRTDIDLERGSVIPVFIRRAIEYPQRRPFIIKGSGKETRSFCYVSDVVAAFILAGEKLNSCRLVGPLNIGSEGRITINDLASEIIGLSGKAVEVEHVAAPTAIWGQAVDCTRARQVLGWYPQFSLREGLMRTFAYVEERLRKEGADVLQG